MFEGQLVLIRVTIRVCLYANNIVRMKFNYNFYTIYVHIFVVFTTIEKTTILLIDRYSLTILVGSTETSLGRS